MKFNDDNKNEIVLNTQVFVLSFRQQEIHKGQSVLTLITFININPSQSPELNVLSNG